MTEADQLRQARKGSATAFEALAAPLEGAVYRLCLRLLRNPADAQDAAQEALLRAYRAMPGFRGGSSFATWLYRIARNVCMDALKSARVKHERASLDALGEAGYDPPADAPAPDEQYEQAARQDALREAIARLPEDQRTLLALRYGEGYDYGQLSQALRLPVGTVKSRLSRAKERLRALLPEENLSTEGTDSPASRPMQVKGVDHDAH